MCETKACTKCGEVKPLTEFHKCKYQKRKAACKVCTREKQRNYYTANQAEQIERTRQWRKLNPEKVREQCRKQYARNPDTVKARVRRWASENRGKALAARREWRKKNAGRLNEQTRERYVRNPEKKLEKRQRHKQTDYYIVDSCFKGLPPGAQVPQALIELKRTQLQLKRAINELKSNSI